MGGHLGRKVKSARPAARSAKTVKRPAITDTLEQIMKRLKATRGNTVDDVDDLPNSLPLDRTVAICLVPVRHGELNDENLATSRPQAEVEEYWSQPAESMRIVGILPSDEQAEEARKTLRAGANEDEVINDFLIEIGRPKMTRNWSHQLKHADRITTGSGVPKGNRTYVDANTPRKSVGGGVNLAGNR